jgi:biopolymer transport protein TolQ
MHRPPSSIALLTSLGVVSKLVLLVLLGFSVVSWAIILGKWRTLHLAEREERQFLTAYAKSGHHEEFRSLASRWKHSPSAILYLGIIDRLALASDGELTAPQEGVDNSPPLDRQYLERLMGHLLQGQIAKQEAYLPFLATTGNVTPFIGLLGTVLGIIDAFQAIGQMGTASITAVAPGVAEALVATAAGLFTAIPAVIAYNYFLTKIRRSVFRAEAFSIEFLNALQTRARHAGTYA